MRDVCDVCVTCVCPFPTMRKSLRLVGDKNIPFEWFGDGDGFVGDVLQIAYA